MSLLDRVNATARAGIVARPSKAFVEPPFWDSDALAWPFRASMTANTESIEGDFESMVARGYKGNGIVFGCIDRRQQVFSQATFKYQRQIAGRPGPLFGDTSLALLERPWPNGTTGELLALMEYDASLAGNAYWTTCDDRGRLGGSARVEDGRRAVRMRPDYTTLVIDAPSGDPYGLDARIVAFSYLPKSGAGAVRQREPVILLPTEVCHYSPKPDPVARFRGMSWLTPIIQDILGDQAATTHKLNFFRNGATPQMAVKFDKDMDPGLFNEFVQKFNDTHRGADNAYKTLFLGGGADIVPLTVDMRQLDFKVTQGGGETRIALAAGVPAVVLQISEGLGGSSLNDGNFHAAKKLFVGTTIQDLWNKVAPSLQPLVQAPAGANLTADTRDIPFLDEDASDAASVQTQRAVTIRQLIDAGYEPPSVVDAVTTDDFTRLVHSGLYSVQLQRPGATAAAVPASGPNGEVPRGE